MDNNKVCKKCGGTKFRKHGIELCITGKKQRHQCVKCGTHYTGETIETFDTKILGPVVEVKQVEPYSKKRQIKEKVK